MLLKSVSTKTLPHFARISTLAFTSSFSFSLRLLQRKPNRDLKQKARDTSRLGIEEPNFLPIALILKETLKRLLYFTCINSNTTEVQDTLKYFLYSWPELAKAHWRASHTYTDRFILCCSLHRFRKIMIIIILWKTSQPFPCCVQHPKHQEWEHGFAM